MQCLRGVVWDPGSFRFAALSRTGAGRPSTGVAIRGRSPVFGPLSPVCGKGQKGVLSRLRLHLF